MAIYHVNVPNGEDLSLLKDEYYTNPAQYNFEYWSYSEGRTQWDNKFVDENKNYWEYPIETTYDFGKILVYWKVYGNGQLLCQVKRKSDSQVLITVEHTNGMDRPIIEYYLDFAVDNDNEKGYCVLASLQYMPNDGDRYQAFVYLADGGESLYNLLVDTSISGGAGSGYIGNNLVSNKKMVGYNVPTSSAESTKTESINEASESPVSGKPKIGNGYVRIKLIRALPDELVLYDNGQVNTDYFDTDAEIGETQAEPISKNYEVKSNHLLLEYNNWRDTTSWRGILLLFNKKMFPSVYTKVKIDLEIYAKYNSGWAAIEFNVNENQTGVKNFNGGVGVIQKSSIRYQISGQNSFEATSRYVTDEMELTDGNNYLTLDFSGVNQYHEGYAKIYKITLTM